MGEEKKIRFGVVANTEDAQKQINALNNTKVVVDIKANTDSIDKSLTALRNDIKNISTKLSTAFEPVGKNIENIGKQFKSTADEINKSSKEIFGDKRALPFKDINTSISNIENLVLRLAQVVKKTEDGTSSYLRTGLNGMPLLVKGIEDIQKSLEGVAQLSDSLFSNRGLTEVQKDLDTARSKVDGLSNSLKTLYTTKKPQLGAMSKTDFETFFDSKNAQAVLKNILKDTESFTSTRGLKAFGENFTAALLRSEDELADFKIKVDDVSYSLEEIGNLFAKKLANTKEFKFAGINELKELLENTGKVKEFSDELKKVQVRPKIGFDEKDIQPLIAKFDDLAGKLGEIQELLKTTFGNLKSDLKSEGDFEVTVKGKLADDFVSDLQSQLDGAKSLEVSVKPVVKEDTELEVKAEIKPKESQPKYLDNIPEGWTKVKGAVTAPAGYEWYSNGKGLKEYESALVKIADAHEDVADAAKKQNQAEKEISHDLEDVKSHSQNNKTQEEIRAEFEETRNRVNQEVLAQEKYFESLYEKAKTTKLSYEEVIAVVGEAEKISSRFTKHNLELQDTDFSWADGEWENYDIGFKGLKSDSENFKQSLIDTYKLYKNVESAIKHNAGMYKGQYYDNSELDSLRGIFQSIASYADDLGIDIDSIVTSIPRITKEFKELAVNAVLQEQQVEENNRQYEGESDELSNINSELKERYRLLQKILTITTEDDVRKTVDVKHALSGGPLALAEFEDKDFQYGNVQTIVKKICDLLEIEIPSAAEKAKEAITEVADTPIISSIDKAEVKNAAQTRATTAFNSFHKQVLDYQFSDNMSPWIPMDGAKADPKAYSAVRSELNDMAETVLRLQKEYENFDTNRPIRELEKLEDELRDAEIRFAGTYSAANQYWNEGLDRPGNKGGASKKVQDLYGYIMSGSGYFNNEAWERNSELLKNKAQDVENHIQQIFKSLGTNQISSQNLFSWIEENGTVAEKEIFRINDGLEEFRKVLRGLATFSGGQFDFAETLGLDTVTFNQNNLSARPIEQLADSSEQVAEAVDKAEAKIEAEGEGAEKATVKKKDLAKAEKAVADNSSEVADKVDKATESIKKEEKESKELANAHNGIKPFLDQEKDKELWLAASEAAHKYEKDLGEIIRIQRDVSGSKESLLVTGEKGQSITLGKNSDGGWVRSSQSIEDHTEEIKAQQKAYQEIEKEAIEAEKQLQKQTKETFKAFEDEQKRYDKSEALRAQDDELKQLRLDYGILESKVNQYVDAMQRIRTNQALEDDIELTEKLNDEIVELADQLENHPLFKQSYENKALKRLDELLKPIKETKPEKVKEEKPTPNPAVEKGLQAYENMWKKRLEISKLDEEADAKEIQALRALEAEYEETYNAQVQALGVKAKELTESQDLLDIQTKYTEKVKEATALTTATKQDDEINNYLKKAQDLEEKVSKLSFKAADKERLKPYRDEIDDLLNKIKQLTNSENKIDIVTKEEENQLDQYKQRYEELNAALNKAENKAANADKRQKMLARVNDILSSNTKRSFKMSDVYKDLVALQKAIRNFDTDRPQKELDELNATLLETEARFKDLDSTVKGKGFFANFSNRLADMNAKFLAQYFSWQDWIRYIRAAATAVADLDKQMVELSKVSGQTLKQIQGDFASYADTAKDLGATISDTISATADWARMGYSVPDSKELARVALLYKNVGDGIDISTANENLISTLQGFQMTADESEKIVDVFNEVYS